MASIADFSQFIDLTLYDKTPEELVDEATTDMQVTFPEWEPRAGNTEMVLLEAFAIMVSELILSVNRVPDGVIQAMLGLFGVPRNPGLPPKTSILFHAANLNGMTIPAGTSVGVATDDGQDPVVFQTDIELILNVGEDEGTVAATAIENTSRVNGVAVDTFVEIIDTLLWVDNAQIAVEIYNGLDEESDADYIQRGIRRFARMSDTLVTANDFFLFIKEFQTVTKCTILDNYDPATAPTPAPGHITAVLYGVGAALTTPQKQEIQDAIDPFKQLNLEVHLIDATIETVDVTVTLTYKDGYSQAVVVDAVEQAIRDYLTPETWDGGDTVRRNELIALISNVDGVDWVDTLTAPAADVPVSDPGNLPDAGTVSITANLA